jgi:uncharacterized membrane protein
MHITTRKLAAAAVTGAAYAALTMLLAPISYGAIQCRVSEVLCILPFFIPCTAWGLFAGCAIANLLSAAGIFDVVFGSLATLLAAPSVAYSDSASGRYVSSTLFHTLGIDDAMQSKAQMVERIPVASEVAKGRYAIGFQQVSELLPVPGVTFVGELPDNLQYITRFAGAVTISADHPQEGKALLTYLASPAAQETIHATGMRSVAAAAPVSQKDTVQ